jgi:hypothetical protein
VQPRQVTDAEIAASGVAVTRVPTAACAPTSGRDLGAVFEPLPDRTWHRQAGGRAPHPPAELAPPGHAVLVECDATGGKRHAANSVVRRLARQYDFTVARRGVDATEFRRADGAVLSTATGAVWSLAQLDQELRSGAGAAALAVALKTL